MLSLPPPPLYTLLGLVGTISQLEVDTHFYKGNFPESCTVEAGLFPASSTAQQLAESEGWQLLLPRTRLSGDRKHFFGVEEGSLRRVSIPHHTHTHTHILCTIMLSLVIHAAGSAEPRASDHLPGRGGHAPTGSGLSCQPQQDVE
ncbi:hypothetical protein EON64_14415 [archaeon]|nr:MAG: hypothetical protein EON64_14415 [archaeon]